jgi:hypothetical protein
MPIANPLHDGPRLESRIRSRLELVGTIECPGQNLKSISWSTDGMHFATISNDHFSVWCLPGNSRFKKQRHGQNIDMICTTPDDVMMTMKSKVETVG